MDKSCFKVGQEVFIAFYDSREKRNNAIVTIVAIGNKWITISDNYRFDYKTMQVDGGQYSAPAEIYMSKEMYDDKQTLLNLFSRLQAETRYHSSLKAGVTIQDMEKVLELLKISKEEVVK